MGKQQRQWWRKFNFQEWRSDEKLRLCDRDVQAVWLDLCGLIYEAGDFGRLSALDGQHRRPYTKKELCRLTGDDPRVMRRALKQLVEYGVCDAEPYAGPADLKDEDRSYLVSRRIAREQLRAEQDSSNGELGGNPALQDKALAQKGVNPPDIQPDKAKELELEFREDDGMGREPDPVLEILEADCRKWANGSLVAGFEGQGLSTISWLMNPEHGADTCTPDDVRVGITEAAAFLHSHGSKRVSSLGYFKNPILEARNQRLSKIPKVEIIDGGHDGANPERGTRSRSGRVDRSKSFSDIIANAALEKRAGGPPQRKNTDGDRARALSRFADDPPADRGTGGGVGAGRSASDRGAPAGAVSALWPAASSRPEPAEGRGGRLDERFGELFGEGVRGGRDDLETIEGTVSADAGPNSGDRQRDRATAA